MLVWFFSISTFLLATVSAWPDGAPCVHAAFESMNPLEAVEHQGGLQLDAPPYEIHVDQKCYWRNQPIALTLQGKNESVWFKGFVIQPFQWDNDRLGPRIGQLVRLDDNGSWQQQCFRFKDSATHSHNEKKKHMRMWWRVDDESQTVQFVATVVRHQTQFWVRSIRSNPIPPCRLNRFGITDYTPPAPSNPPPVKPFKMETHRVFDNEGLTPRTGNDFTTAPTTPSFTTRVTESPSIETTKRVQMPNSVPDRMNRIIPLPQMEVVHNRHSAETTTIATTARPIFTTRSQLAFQNRRFGSREPVQPRPVAANPSVRPNPGVCVDRDQAARCRAWLQYCRTPQFFNYMSSFCRKTCGFC